MVAVSRVALGFDQGAQKRAILASTPNDTGALSPVPAGFEPRKFVVELDTSAVCLERRTTCVVCRARCDGSVLLLHTRHNMAGRMEPQVGGRPEVPEVIIFVGIFFFALGLSCASVRLLQADARIA